MALPSLKMNHHPLKVENFLRHLLMIQEIDISVSALVVLQTFTTKPAQVCRRRAWLLIATVVHLESQFDLQNLRLFRKR